MRSRVLLLCITAYLLVLAACKNKETKAVDPAEVVHQNVDELTQIIIYDVFSPPVASRIYAYTTLAQYEAMRHAEPGMPSFAANLNGFPALPSPEPSRKYDFTLAGTEAFLAVAGKMIFAKDTLAKYKQAIEKQYGDILPKDVFENSLAFGTAIGDQIWKRAMADHYKETRGMAKYLGSTRDGYWQPTSPDYLDGVEPYWKMIMPFTLASDSQFRPMPPSKYDTARGRPYFRMVNEVYEKSKSLTEEERTIARFWDDNPFVMEHAGHTMFGNKKITPGGHWMGITAIACRKSGASAAKSAQSYSLTSMALLDAFISCWEAKYHYEYIRPITLINKWIDREWTSFLQTPPFPEYTSGHSTISGASSYVLTQQFGDNFAFHDNADSLYIGMVRDFPSFNAAADEASVSRLYGGIHFRASLDTGLSRGRMIGAHIINKLGLNKTSVSSR